MRLIIWFILVPISVALLGPTWVAFYRDKPIVDPLTFYLFPDDTVYSAKFNESRFKRIEEGWSMRAVEELLGTPVTTQLLCSEDSQQLISSKVKMFNHEWVEYERPGIKDCKGRGEQVWNYTKSGGSTHYYFKRDVVFNHDGVVSMIIATYDD